MNPEVEAYFEKAKQWQDEMRELRKIVLDCHLAEAFKWRAPCYTFEQSNVVMISGFKEYCALSFFKGALLKDARGILAKPGENTRSARLIRFTALQEIVEMEAILKAYIHEAIQIEKAGLKVDFEKDRALSLPEELQQKLEDLPALKVAFEALTPGRQRAYVLHFTAAKQPKTRESRIEACMPRILDGKGPNDCICGQSKKMPNCDGSHKHIR